MSERSHISVVKLGLELYKLPADVVAAYCAVAFAENEAVGDCTRPANLKCFGCAWAGHLEKLTDLHSLEANSSHMQAKSPRWLHLKNII